MASSAAAENVSNKKTLCSFDGDVFDPVRAVIVEPQTSRQLSKDKSEDKPEDKPSDADGFGFHFDYPKLNPVEFVYRAKAAAIESGNNKSPLDIACQVAANMKRTTPEVIHKAFNTRMNDLASLNINLDQSVADIIKKKTPEEIRKMTKNKENYLTSLNINLDQSVANMIKEETPVVICKTTKNTINKAVNNLNNRSGSPLGRACQNPTCQVCRAFVADMIMGTTRVDLGTLKDFMPKEEEALRENLKNQCLVLQKNSL